MFYVNAYTYSPSNGSKVTQGVKGGRRPKNAIYGGNGSYRTVNKKAEVILSVTDDDNNPKEIDIAPALREIAYRHNTTLSRAKALTFCDALVNTSIKEYRGFIDNGSLDEIWSKTIG